MVTTKQKSKIDTEKIKRKESNNTTIVNDQCTKQKRKKGTMELQNNQKIINKMTLVSPYLSLITLDVNGINSPINRHRVTEWIKQQDTITCCLQRLTSIRIHTN